MVRLTRSKTAMNYSHTIKEEDSTSLFKGKRLRKKTIESSLTVNNKNKNNNNISSGTGNYKIKNKYKVNTYNNNPRSKEVDKKPKTLQDKLFDIWKAIRYQKDGRNRPMSKLFIVLPDKNEYPDYYLEIKDPISLEIIKSKIEKHEYKDEDEFVSDMDLMFNNAKRYNVEGSQIYEDSVILSKLVHKLIGGKFENEDNQTYKTLQRIEHKGETYFVGEFAHIYNEYDNEKPHILHIYKLWENNKGVKGLYGCYYYRAEQTKHNLWQKFYENEVFKTNTFQDHQMHDVLGKCYVINVNDFKTGYPKGLEGKSIYVCESRYNEISKTFNKIKNWSSLTPSDNHALAIRFEIRETPIVLNKIESPLAAEFKAKRFQKEDSSASEDIFSPNASYDSQSDVPTTHIENKSNESNNAPLSSARIRITSKKLAERYKSDSNNLTNSSCHQTKSTSISSSPMPSNPQKQHNPPGHQMIHPQYQMQSMNVASMYNYNNNNMHNNGMVSTHIQQNSLQSHYIMSPFPSSQYYRSQQPRHYHSIDQQLANQNITASYTNSLTPSSFLQCPQNPTQTLSRTYSKALDDLPINNGVNSNISSPHVASEQEILKSFQEPKHSAEYIKHREEIIAKNKKRLRENEGYNDSVIEQNKKQKTELPQVNEAELLKTIQELSNKWKNEAMILNQRLN